MAGALMEAGEQALSWWKRVVQTGVITGAPLWPLYVAMYAVGGLHLVEVLWIDPVATAWVQGIVGASVTLFAPLEAGIHHAIGSAWTPERVAGVSVYYLLGFVGLLAWTPHIVAMMGDRGRLRRVLLTYPLIYLLGLPGYLLIPQANPYVSLGLADPFSPLHAGLEDAYYVFTTVNNTFPSLHVAFTVALTGHLAKTGSELIGGAAIVHGVLLVASVVYLRVHWIGDVFGGILVAVFALALADRAARGRGRLGGLVSRLERSGRQRLAWLRPRNR